MGWMPFLSPNQQCQSMAGKISYYNIQNCNGLRILNITNYSTYDNSKRITGQNARVYDAMRQATLGWHPESDRLTATSNTDTSEKTRIWKFRWDSQLRCGWSLACWSLDVTTKILLNLKLLAEIANQHCKSTAPLVCLLLLQLLLLLPQPPPPLPPLRDGKSRDMSWSRDGLEAHFYCLGLEPWCLGLEKNVQYFSFQERGHCLM